MTTVSDTFADQAAGPPADGRKSYVIYYDATTKGFGLRVTKAGAKSWILNYRAGGIERRYTIGSHRDPWRAAAARKRALELKALIDMGQDPQGEKHAIRVAPTVNDLIERWRTDHAPRKRERSRVEDEKLIAQWIRPELGTRKVADLRYADVDAFHRKVTRGKRRATPYRGNRALALLSKMLALAVRWEMRADNPCRSVERNHEERRYRYLRPEELERLTEALAGHPNQVAADAVRLLLLTGARKGEVLRATWSQFDLDKGVWTKPSSHTKDEREHVVPLSEAAVRLLTQTRRTSPLVFPGIRDDLFTDWAALCKAAKIEGARVHDLRHSYASYLVSAGVSLPIVGSLLGHTTPATTARYAHILQDPARQATEKVASIVMARDHG
jgi:integrase